MSDHGRWAKEHLYDRREHYRLGRVYLCIKQRQKTPFTQAVFQLVGALDDDVNRADVIEFAQQLPTDHVDLGAIQLDCSDLPRFAPGLKGATGLPACDFINMINHVHEALGCKPIVGVI